MSKTSQQVVKFSLLGKGGLHGPKYGTVQLSTTHKVRSLTDPTEGVANSYSRLNRPIMYVPITVLKAL